jgi:hypothetical protein
LSVVARAKMRDREGLPTSDPRAALAGFLQPIGGHIGRIWRYAWAAPASLVGMLFATVALCFGARAKICEGAVEVNGGRLAGRVASLPGRLRFGAITFGHVILGLDADTLEHCRAHEHVHVRQYERWGVLFFVAYPGASLLAWIRGGDPYRDNVFEVEARSCERASGSRDSSRR